ncbi:MAG: hypothetical protein ACTSPY_13215 [Candidatus Helarchaeota archaeon]
MAEFARFMESISSEATETKINELSDILNEVLQIITKALDDLTFKMVGLEEKVNALNQRIYNLQQRAQNIRIAPRTQTSVVSKPISVNNASQSTIDQNNQTSSASSKPAVPTKVAVNTELKNLFKKLKK